MTYELLGVPEGERALPPAATGLKLLKISAEPLLWLNYNAS